MGNKTMNPKSLVSSSFLAATLAAGALAAPRPAWAADAVSFTPGNPWAQEVGSISKTDDYHEYTVHASGGKTLKINLISRDPNLFFKVLPPDSHKALIDTMSNGETSWSTQPAADAEYTVRVYAEPDMM
ncbi:MAG: hypothetical protein ACREMY_30805, partial [bacterium]